ncbi:hypothetical protein LT493_10255 [Streptomyces tricolor]|nr:hypothetical protein [Streptomyces tricolor]
MRTALTTLAVRGLAEELLSCLDGVTGSLTRDTGEQVTRVLLYRGGSTR